jgi:hypothetical protein
MSTFSLSNRVEVLNPCSDIDHSYGPYWGTTVAEAISKAKVEFGDLLNEEYNKEMVGRTIGIIVSANETDDAAIVEYWWQYVPAEGDQPAKYDFVEKTAEIDLSLLDGDCVTSEDITSTVTVGAISQSGKVEKGTTLEAFIKQLLVKLLIPTGSSVSGLISGVTTQTVEVGTTITSTLTASFTDGSVKNYGKGVINPTDKPLGCAATQTQYKRIINGAETTAIGTPVTGTTGYKDSYKIKQENVRYCADISYSAPTFTEPLDSEGGKHTLSELKITSAAGTLTTGNTNIIKGEYQYYVGVYDVDENGVKMIPTLEEVRSSLNDSSNWMSKAISATKNDNLSGIQINEGGKRGAVLYIPADYSIITIYTSGFENITNKFTSEDVTLLDAGGNSVAYKRYTKWDSSNSDRDLYFKVKTN